MKTKKLNLHDLKVESFITALEKNDSQTLKGGYTTGGLAVGFVISVAGSVALSVYILTKDAAENNAGTTESKQGNSGGETQQKESK